MQRLLTDATESGYRNRLLARGQARAVMREGGVLPSGAPEFAAGIESDLSDYAFSVLRTALAFKETHGEERLWKQGFLQAADAFESLVRNGDPREVDRGFLRVMGASAYHLAGYSAMAYSLISQRAANSNMAPAEEALVQLLLRNLVDLKLKLSSWLRNERHQDKAVTADLLEGEINADDVVAVVTTSAIYRGLAFLDFALQTGDETLVHEARRVIRDGLRLAPGRKRRVDVVDRSSNPTSD